MASDKEPRKSLGITILKSCSRQDESMEKEVMKKRKWYSLIDKVYNLPNLLESWYEVKRNKDKAGVDRETIREALIPKTGSKEMRPLGIPTIRDRVVQQAIKRVIEPIFEAKFKEVSYGYRPNKGAKDAIHIPQTG